MAFNQILLPTYLLTYCITTDWGCV